MTRRFFKILLATFVGATACFLILTKAHRTQDLQTTILDRERSVRTENRPSASKEFSQLVRESRSESLSEDVKRKLKADAQDEQCLNSYSQILDVKIVENMKAQDLPANFGGCSSESEQVAAVRTKYEELCATARSDRKSKEESEKAALECFSAFILLRSTANAWIHRDDKIEEMTDQKTLVDILIGSIGAGDIDRFEAAAVRMRQLAPDMYEPLKANIVAKVMRASQVAETDESKVSDYMSLLERDLAAATTIPNSDPELQEALIMSRTRLMKDHGRMEEVVDELRRSGQKGPVLAYYEAAVLWHKGEHKKVIETMRDLSRQFPNETRYSETLENLLKDPEGKDSKGHFISRLSVHFDLTGDLKDLKVEQ